jgi:acyl-CoA thioester hydrolase
MRIASTSVQIRFSDIDWMGHVNNAVYLTYLETARLDYFNQTDLTINWRETGFILARTEINYKAPLLLNDSIKVKTWCTSIGEKSFQLCYAIHKMDGKDEIEAANALTVLVCYDYRLKQSVPLPEAWKKYLI